MRLVVTVVLVLAGAGLLVVATNPRALSNFIPLFALAVLWVVLLWAIPWWAARRQFTRQPAVQGPRTMVLDARGAHWRWDGGAADIEWKNFVRCTEGKSQFLLYTSPACFNIVPKRSLTPEQMSELRELLHKNPLPR